MLQYEKASKCEPVLFSDLQTTNLSDILCNQNHTFSIQLWFLNKKAPISFLLSMVAGTIYSFR